MSIKPSHILGMNARYYYTKQNSKSSRKFGFSKLRTKGLLKEHKIPTAQIYQIIRNSDQLDVLRWETIPTPFVIKPTNGSAGKGILVIKQKLKNKSIWVDSDGKHHGVEDLNLHVRNILDGEFSTWGGEYSALIEEMIEAHSKLRKLAHRGTPDLRVVIFNSVPVMAMLRVPTKESHGRANLDQGALGIGIDIATGVTTYGLRGKAERITHFPDSSKKVNGILIPFWQESLELAVRAANAAGYMFMGCDLFISETGPLVVELNGFPGLSIQLANRAGLKRRLERVEGLDVQSAAHGVKIGQALFAEQFADKVKVEEGLTIIPINPKIIVYGDDARQHQIDAIVNTGRFRSAIAENLAERLGLLDLEDLLWRQQEEIEGKLPVVEVHFKLKKKKIKTAMLVSKRLNRTKQSVELGRKDTEGFLIGETE